MAADKIDEASDLLRSTGIGGPLLCLVSGLSGWHPKVAWWCLSPLWFVLLVPLTLVAPPALPIILLFWLQRSWRHAAELPLAVDPRDDSAVKLRLVALDLGAVLRQQRHLLMGLVMAYYLIAIGGSFILSSALQSALNLYMAQAQAHKVLQIATPEQIAYSNSVVHYIALYLIVVALTIITIFATTIVALFTSKDPAGTQVLALPRLASAVATLLGKNLPGIAMILALFYGVIMTVERYYAHFRIVAVEAMILGQDYFDPSIWFLLLRGYLIQAFFVALVLVLFMGCGLLAPSHQNDKSN